MERSHFVRITTADKVEQTLADLAELNPEDIETLTQGSVEAGFVQVYAPDGDCVFAAIEKAPGAWIARFHREVFAEAH